MKLLIGIDDTDNLESRGTGFRARQLGEQIEFHKLGSVECITRHQLLFDSRIPYTSHNSSACLEVEAEDIDKITSFCRTYMIENAAIGSDVGLAIARADVVDDEVVMWGKRAKIDILTKVEAYSISNAKDIYLEGLTGTKDGIIGALAAIGLRKFGNDGRCIGLKGKDVRELSGIYTVHELSEMIKFDRIVDLDGDQVHSNSKIFVGDWFRAVISGNKITIFVTSKNIEGNYEFKIATKDYIKSISD